MSDSVNIAKEIQNQLFHTVGQNVLWSWGQSALQSVRQSSLEEFGITNGLGALKFKVNGHHHKGHVLIVLNGVDTYDVYICNIRKGQMKVKEKVKGLYFDEVGNWIDDKVEYIEEYAS